MMTKKLGYVALLSVASVSTALAADSLPAPGKLTVGGVQVRALVDTYYQYNFNRTGLSAKGTTGAGQSGVPQTNYRSYDTSHRAFDINQATVGLSYAPAPVGFDVRIGTGNQLEVLNKEAGSSQTTFKHIRTANATWKPNRFHLTVGRYDLNFGLERIDSVDNWNYGRGILFTTNTPLFMTGLEMGYDFGSGFNAVFGYGNGVDRYVDNNKSGSYMLKLGYTTGGTNLNLNYMLSPERFDVGTQFRHYVSLNGTHKYSDSFHVGAEFSFVRGQNEYIGNQANGTRRDESTSSYGAALYAAGSFVRDHWEAIRGEWLQDADGRVTKRAAGTTFFTVTGTHRYKVSQNMSLLGEVRWDHANRDRFLNQALQEKRDNQVTLSAAATFNI
jgi:hypothetical protein